MRRWRAADPLVVDALLAVVCAALSIGTVLLTDEPRFGPDLGADGVLLLLGQSLPVAIRRWNPVLAWAVAGACTAAYGIGEYPDTVLDLGPLLIIYTVASVTPRRTATALGVVTALTILGGLVSSGDADAKDFSFNLLVYATAWVVGEHQRTRRAYTDSLEEKAARLEADRAEAERRAVADERARIASELHDVVAHSVSMMVVQAEGGASVVATDPQRAAAAFDAIGTTGRRAMGEMRRVLQVLRDADPAGSLAPQPGLDALDHLAADVAATGLAVAVGREGTARTLPDGLDLSAYRIVQEALTNTVRHAGATRADVTVRWLDGAVEVEVVDDGSAGPGGGDGGATGHGLVGMRERVALYGGELEAGPRPGGGFGVRARLPVVT